MCATKIFPQYKNEEYNSVQYKNSKIRYKALVYCVAVCYAISVVNVQTILFRFFV